MAKKKVKKLTWEITPKQAQGLYKAFGKGVDKVIFDRLNKLVNKEIREMRKHFKKDKWPLSYDVCRGQIIADLIGKDPEYFIVAKLVKAGFKVTLGNDPTITK